jgi:hypothetical protein
MEAEPRRSRRIEPEHAQLASHAPRRVVASYDSYTEAQSAVDHLSDEEVAEEASRLIPELRQGQETRNGS